MTITENKKVFSRCYCRILKTFLAENDKSLPLSNEVNNYQKIYDFLIHPFDKTW